MTAMDDTGIYASGDKMKQYIKNIQEQDIDKFVIIKSKLIFIGSDEFESNIAQNLGLGGGNNASAAQEIQSIVDGVLELGKSFNTVSETNDASKGLIGVKLYPREGNIVNGKWNIVDEYDTSNKKIARYENGYLLESGETYKINNENIKFENSYIIDYEKNDFILLSDRAVNWNEDSTLAVDGAVLNLDTMAFENGEWRQNTTDTNYYDFYVKTDETEVVNNVVQPKWENTGIQKKGDVEYNSTIKGLKLNEDTTNNEDGIGGYLRLYKNGLDFSNGFTFEMYGKPTRQEQEYGEAWRDNFSTNLMGLFNRGLETPGNVNSVLRFCYRSSSGFVADFCNESAWIGDGDNFKTVSGGDVVWNGEDYYIEKDKEFYLTVVYKRSFNENDEDYQFVTANELDKIIFYMNGKCLGHTYYAKTSFNVGMDEWNNNDCPFQIGRTPMTIRSNYYYFKGNIYTTRLYTKTFTEKNVKDSYDMTLKYRDSF